jgi:hypothetical protein
MLPLGASFLFVLRRLRGGHTYCCGHPESDVSRGIFNVKEQLATLRLLFFAEFLESGIIPQWIEHRIEPEQRRGER